MLEGAKATTETVDALRSGASAMKAIQKATYDALSFRLFLSLRYGSKGRINLYFAVLFTCWLLYFCSGNTSCRFLRPASLLTDCAFHELEGITFVGRVSENTALVCRSARLLTLIY